MVLSNKKTMLQRHVMAEAMAAAFYTVLALKVSVLDAI